MNTTQQQSTCPKCGAALRTANFCWLCRSPVVSAETRPKEVVATENRIAPIQFGLDSMLLLMTFVAVVCGVFVVAPGAGVMVAVLALPALIRTAILARRDRVAGEPMAWGVKTLTFLATMSFVVVLIASMAAAFYATCWVGFWAGAFGHSVVDPAPGYDALGTGLIVGIVVGIIAAALVMWWLIRRAVKTNYRVPAWTGWFGFVVSLGSLTMFWILYSYDFIVTLPLALSGIGLVFSLLGLGEPKGWNTAWGVGLGAGPLASWLLIILIHQSVLQDLSSIAAPISATLIALAIAAPLHWWVMRMEVESRIEKPG